MTAKMVPIEPFTPQVKIQTWGTETIIASTPEYLGKILIYKAGKAGGLQAHARKVETFYLHEGEAWVDYDQDGKIVRVKMTPGMSFHIPSGAPHRFEAITDCVVFEASTPVFEDRVRLEDFYGVDFVGDEFGLPTTSVLELPQDAK